MSLHDLRLQPSGLNQHFDFKGGSFSEYIQHCQTMIRDARIKLDADIIEQVIKANSPFECFPTDKAKNPTTGRYQRGILLIHGLFDSPNCLINLASYFQAKGFLVRAILLPGHGTVPGDLLNIDKSEWFKAMQYGIESLTNEVDDLYLGGISTGGALALCHTYENPSIKGLLLFSPALAIRPEIIFINQKTLALRKLLRNRWKMWYWLTIMPDQDYAKYESAAFNAAEQLHNLTLELAAKRDDKILSQPIFTALSYEDEVIDPKVTLNFFANTSGVNNQLILYTKNGYIAQDPRVETISSVISEKRIVDFSHMSIPISPSHPHYGENGDYHPCYEIIRINNIPIKNNATKEIYNGALSFNNLRKYKMRRLSYNPYFSSMQEKLDKFLAVNFNI